MILLAQQNGSGPIVSLGFGPSGAPAVLANAPLALALEPTDLLLISRNGQLMGIGSNELDDPAALQALQPQFAGIVPPSGFWITPQGIPQRAPSANLTFQLDASVALVGELLCDWLDLFGGLPIAPPSLPNTDLSNATNADVALTSFLILEVL